VDIEFIATECAPGRRWTHASTVYELPDLVTANRVFGMKSAAALLRFPRHDKSACDWTAVQRNEPATLQCELAGKPCVGSHLESWPRQKGRPRDPDQVVAR